MSESSALERLLPETIDAKVQILLADSAQIIRGKLHVDGGGWTVMGPGPTPVAVALTIEIPWTGDDRAHDWKVALVDDDGQPVLCSEHGTHVIERAGSFSLSNLSDQPPGFPASTVLAIQFSNLSMTPGRGFRWIFELDGVTKPAWQQSFRCRSA